MEETTLSGSGQRSPLLDRAGAVPAGGPDEGVAAHYGDPYREQRAMDGGLDPETVPGGFTDRSQRGVVRVTGPERLGWLHSLTSQQLSDLEPGSSAEALILDPNGHAEHHLVLTDDGTATWLHVEPGTAAALTGYLDSMRFMTRAEVTDVSGEHAVLSLLGPGRDRLARGLGTVSVSWKHGRYEGTDLIVPRDQLGELAAELERRGAVPAGMLAFEALRIAGHQPRLGVDTDARTLPHEAGWIGTAVHLNKGCYRGQETVARIHNLGHPPRRLVLLDLDGSVDTLPGPGEPVELDGVTVGVTGSAARHYDQGPIALALVKRTVPVSSTLLAGGVAAGQQVIVPPDAGANVKVTLKRRSLL